MRYLIFYRRLANFLLYAVVRYANSFERVKCRAENIRGHRSSQAVSTPLAMALARTCTPYYVVSTAIRLTTSAINGPCVHGLTSPTISVRAHDLAHIRDRFRFSCLRVHVGRHYELFGCNWDQLGVPGAPVKLERNAHCSDVKIYHD